VTRPASDELGFTHRFLAADPAIGGRGGRTPPVLLLLHGTGGNEDDLLPLGRTLAPGAALLSPRGKVLEHGMPRFFRRLAEGVFDLPDLIARTHDLAKFIRAAVTHYGLDSERLVAVGFSNGANIGGSLLLLHPGLLRAAILLRPMVPFEPDVLPDLKGTAVFVSAGRTDPIVPPSNSERLAALLREAGADVTLAWQPGGHNLTSPEVEAAGRWLAKHSGAR
jgi:phospholipase/carboxylesterase